MRLSPKTVTGSSALSRVALAAIALSFLGVVAHATDAPAAPAQAEKAVALPLKGKFEKVKGSEKAPYVLHLQNTSKKPVTASAKVLLSVAMHADSKARLVPAEVVAPGKVWTISDLAAQDKVIVTSAGFAPLELTVP